MWQKRSVYTHTMERHTQHKSWTEAHPIVSIFLTTELIPWQFFSPHEILKRRIINIEKIRRYWIGKLSTPYNYNWIPYISFFPFQTRLFLPVLNNTLAPCILTLLFTFSELMGTKTTFTRDFYLLEKVWIIMMMPQNSVFFYYLLWIVPLSSELDPDLSGP